MNDFYKMAVKNIGEKGDTDIFPFPIEKYLFQDKQDEILEILSDMDKNYGKLIKTDSVDCIKTCVPNNYRGFRWGTMIDPIWNAFYLGEVLKISNKIDKKRIAPEENFVFSYRLKYDEDSGLLFNLDYNYKAYSRVAHELAEKRHYVINIDIADFYNKISHARLKNALLSEVNAEASSVNRIMELISKIAGDGETYGLPIGGNASRILAEAYLIKADNFMKDKGIRFCRFVDDYYIFSDSLNSAYSILNICADYFHRNLGLSFQKSKTSIMSRSDFMTHSRSVVDEIEREKDPARASILSLKLGRDKYMEMGNEEMRDLKDKINGLEFIKLLKLECKKTEINQMFGKQLVNAVQVLEEKDQSLAFEVLSENFEKLYPVFPVIMRKAYYNLSNCEVKIKEKFIARLAELFEKDSYIVQTDNNASYALRVLSLADNDTTRKAINNIYTGNTKGYKESSCMRRMNAIYAMTNLENTTWLTERMDDFPQLSTWERRALVASSPFVGKKGESWRKSHKQSFSPLENLVGEWVYEKLTSNPKWKLPL